MRIPSLLILFCLVCVHFSFSQTSEDSLPAQKISKEFKSKKNRVFSNVYKTNPFMVIWGPIPLTSEFRLINESVIANKQSVLLGFSYLGKSLLLALYENSVNQVTQQPETTVKGFRVQAAYRYYFSNKKIAPRGPYISLHYSYSKARFSNHQLSRFGIYSQLSNFNLNLLGGIQFIARNGFAIDLFGGLGYKKYEWIDHYSQTKITTRDISELGAIYDSPLHITIGFNIGLAF